MTTLELVPGLMPVEEITPGDRVFLPHGEGRVVSGVEEYGDVLVVVYFQQGQTAYENRATAHGARHLNRLVEQSLRPLRRGELIPAVQGLPVTAVQLRAQLGREQLAREERLLDRIGS